MNFHRHDVAEKWRCVVKKICSESSNGEAPRFPVDKLSEFERLFQNDDGEEQDLSPEEFMAGMSEVVGGHYHSSQWMKLFVDIDADRGGTVSWDEFTTFMVHQSVGLVAEYNRAKEFVPLPPPSKLQNAHKEPAKHFVGLGKNGHFASAGTDGTIRIWGTDLTHVKTVNNSKLAASSELGSYASTVPISDLTVAGSICCVSSVDKCINLFHADSMQLCKRYIGRNLFNDISISPMYIPNCSKPIDTCVLMGMSDGLSTAEFHQLPSGRELFVTGLMDGSLNVYPAHRLSLAPEIRPVLSVPRAHNGNISKVRLENSFGHIISAGWDTTICITDAESGVITTRFEGVDSSEHNPVVGHAKAIVDFSYHDGSKTLATVSSERDICLWNPSMATPIQKLVGHTGHLTSVRFNDQENQLISLSQDNMIKVWDMRTYRTFQTIVFSNPLHISAIHYDPPTSRLVGLAGVPYAWCVRRTHCGFSAAYRGHIEPMAGLCYHKELDVLVTADQCSLMTWEVKNGMRLLVWEGVREPQKLAATCLDFSGRRLCAVTRDGCVLIYNHRSGQLMREEKTTLEDVFACIYLAKLPNHVYLAVVSPNAIAFLKELADNDFETTIVPLPSFHFVCAERGPADSYGVPTVVVGSSDGSVATLSATMKGVMSHFAAPPPSLGDPMQEYAGSKPISKQIESIAVLVIKGLIITVCGDRAVYVWSTGKKGAHIFTYYLKECSSLLLALDHNIAETRLFVGDETGSVHAYSIERLPIHRKTAVYSDSDIEHLASFSTHSKSITRIICLSHRQAIVVLGADLKIRLFSWAGVKIGTFGDDEWNVPLSSKLFCAHEPIVRVRRNVTNQGGSIFLTTIDDRTATRSRKFESTTANDAVQLKPSTAQIALRSHRLHEQRRTAMTPVLGTKRSEGILKRSSTPEPSRGSVHPAEVTPALNEMHHEVDDVLSFNTTFDGRSTMTNHRSRSPTRWKQTLDKSSPEPSLPTIVALKQTFELSRSASREWARCGPESVVCRAEQRSETSRRIFDARRRNPTGWSSFMVSSFLPVEQLSATVLQAPKGARLPSLSKKGL